MSATSSIQWTDATWNPGIYGCDEVSPGCANCYAVVLAHRLAAMGKAGYTPDLTKPVPAGGRAWTGEVRVIDEHFEQIEQPLHWRKPRRVFVNSMTDLFHESVPDSHLDRVFAVMALTPQHTYQVLTKRPDRMRAYMSASDVDSRILEAMQPLSGLKVLTAEAEAWPLPNVWLGVSAEDQDRANERIPLLLDTPAAARFVSYEPALGPIDFRVVPIPVTGARELATSRLDWIIVGGESGPRARPFDLAWARSVIQQCRRPGAAAVFVKQLGAAPMFDPGEPGNPKLSPPTRLRDFPRGWEGRHRWFLRLEDRHGGDIQEWPEDLRVREFPSRTHQEEQ